jgi:hypothetical protein
MVEGALHPDAVRIATGQERRAARRADSLGDVEIRETSSLGSQAIEVRGPDVFSPETAKVAVTEVIDQDQHNVRRPVDGMAGYASKQQD